MATNSERVLGRVDQLKPQVRRLFSVEQTRALERAHPVTERSSSLMQIAGLALAQLTLAAAPHAQRVWVACGPGNNGGDGLEAAAHLQKWGKQVLVSLAHDPSLSSPDARRAWTSAQASGATLSNSAPTNFDVCIDALFGFGPLRPLSTTYADWVQHMHAAKVPIVAADIPSGLNADTGVCAGVHVVASHTLSLLTLKPGLFTGVGRDACGEIWFNDLGVSTSDQPAAMLSPHWTPPARPHASHKGSFGDVCVIGGAIGMVGAALLAARSALHGGAGRVFVCPLAESGMALDTQVPELMFRSFEDLDWSGMTIVAGCGGGQAIADHLPHILRGAKQLVLDADALNRVAESPALQAQITQRAPGSTVLTPHPLEAARLLASTANGVQADRLGAARRLAERYQCVVVLKGSGTVIADPHVLPCINPTGNARLASAGTGDVLAGLIGALLANRNSAWQAAIGAVYRHGLAADRWRGQVLSAAALCRWD